MSTPCGPRKGVLSAASTGSLGNSEDDCSPTTVLFFPVSALTPRATGSASGMPPAEYWAMINDDPDERSVVNAPPLVLTSMIESAPVAWGITPHSVPEKAV